MLSLGVVKVLQINKKSYLLELSKSYLRTLNSGGEIRPKKILFLEFQDKRSLYRLNFSSKIKRKKALSEGPE